MWEYSSIRNKKGFFFGITDYVFKNTLFEKDESLTIWFLEKLLGFKVNTFELKKTEIPKKNKDDKNRYLDIVVIVNSTILLDIEVNTSFYKGLSQRNLGYAMNLYNKYIVNDRIKTDINELKLINLTIGLGKKYKDIANKSNIQTIYYERYVQDFEILTFDIDKVKNYWYSWDEAMICKYCYLIMLVLGKEDLSKLCNLSGISKRDKKYLNEFREEVIAMNESIDQEMWRERYHIYKWGLQKQREEWEEKATKRGLAKGMAKGKAEGRAEGLTQGIEQNKIENARKMIQNNISIDLVSKCTGLSLTKLEEIQNSLVNS